jgi:Predicted permeases
MKIIDRYIFKKFIGTFFFAISLLIVVVIIFDLSENIDSFVKHRAPWQQVVFNYYINFIPYFINLFIYLFTFIAVIFFTSKMAGNTEVIAILSSGISFWRFLYPYLLASVMLAVMSLYFGNFLIPKTNEVRRVFKDEYMEKLAKSAGRNIHVQIGKDEYVYVESFNIKKNIGYKFSIEKYDDTKLKYKMLADIITSDSLEPNRWKINNYTERFLEGFDEKIIQGQTKDTVLNLVPSDLYKMKEDFEEMNFFELRDHIERMKMKGSEGVMAYEVEMQQRMASPAAIIILTFIGAALSSRKVRGGMGMHLGLGIAIAFSYILFMQVSKVFATSGNLSPFLAAWIPNFIYCIMGIYFLIKAPK